MTYARLHRSSKDKKLFGVAGGLGEYFNVDPVLVRLALVFLCFATGGAAILLYFVMAIVMPKEETGATGTSGVTQGDVPGGAGEASEGEARRSSTTSEIDRGRNFLALALIAVGALFLCANIVGFWWSGWLFSWLFNWSALWPMLLVVVGVAFLMRRSGRTL